MKSYLHPLKMTKLLIVFAVIISTGCKEKHSEAIVGTQFKDYGSLNQLANFEKVSDTTFFNDEIEPKFKLLHLKNKNRDLVIYSRIQYDSKNNRIYKVLDTLSFLTSDNSEKLTIGYCEIDLKNNNKGNVIALIEKPDDEIMFIKKIKKAWVANPDSERIEKLKNIDKVDCFNDSYNGNETKINYDLLNK